jgi:GTP cyclohydrolase II
MNRAAPLNDEGNMPAEPDDLEQVARIDTARLPTIQGQFEVTAYRDRSGNEHLVVRMGPAAGEPPPVVRLHSECLTGDVLALVRCDCREQLQISLA